VITITDGIPSRGFIMANVHALARYAALCQEAGLVPIAGPEVLMEITKRKANRESLAFEAG
jgi:fructose-bisphosphate aldolase class I